MYYAASHLCLVRDIGHEVVLGAVDELEGGGLHTRGRGGYLNSNMKCPGL